MASTVTTPNGEVFRVETERVDASSMHRPATWWRFTDAAGHTHRWYADGKPAEDYNHSAKHSTPSLKWVKDGEAYWPDDDEPHDVGHTECIQCGEHIEPQFTTDSGPVYIAGLRHYYINDEPVSPDEFQQRFKRAAYERALTWRSNAPVKLADGKFGMLIRWYEDSSAVGVQVHGEENIREIKAVKLTERNGALTELKD